MTPRPLHTLTEQEAQLVAQLKKDVAPVVEQHDHLKVFCNEHTYVRYLRARQWNLQKASKMLHTTLEWRLTYKPHEIQWDEVKHESDTGKQYVYHVTDKEGRPIVLMRPRCDKQPPRQRTSAENTKTHESQVRFLILNLEIASKMADDLGVGKMTWLLDFGGYSMSNAPPLKVSLHCNHILQHHYPERLGCAVCYHAPMLFTMTWKAVAPFIDPVTKAKIHFVEKGAKEKADMEARFYMEEMEKCIGGGKDDYVWDQPKYTAKVNEFCAERAAAFAAAGAKPHKAGDADVLLKGAGSVPAKEGVEVAAAPEGSAVVVAAS